MHKEWRLFQNILIVAYEGMVRFTRRWPILSFLYQFYIGKILTGITGFNSAHTSFVLVPSSWTQWTV